jgi:hypothetical protein
MDREAFLVAVSDRGARICKLLTIIAALGIIVCASEGWHLAASICAVAVVRNQTMIIRLLILFMLVLIYFRLADVRDSARFNDARITNIDPTKPPTVKSAR